MSVHVLAGFMSKSKSELGARLVGMVLSDSAWDDGITWLPVKKIAERTRLSERQVYRALNELEELGELERRRRKRGNIYRMRLGASVPQYERLPFEIDDPFDELFESPDNLSGDSRVTHGVTPTSGGEVTPTSGDTSYRRKEERKRTWSVDRKTVTELEEQFAQLVLADWNARTGQTLTAREWLAMIVMRQREHPEFTVAEIGDVVAANLADPWWKGTPSPNVIWGSGAQFERALTIAATPASGDEQAVNAARSRFTRLTGGRK